MTLCRPRTTVYYWQTTHPLRNIMYDCMEACRLRADNAGVPRLTKVWRGPHNRQVDRVCIDALNAITMGEIGVGETRGVVDMGNDLGRAMCCMNTPELLLKAHLTVKETRRFLLTCKRCRAHATACRHRGLGAHLEDWYMKAGKELQDEQISGEGEGHDKTTPHCNTRALRRNYIKQTANRSARFWNICDHHARSRRRRTWVYKINYARHALSYYDLSLRKDLIDMKAHMERSLITRVDVVDRGPNAARVRDALEGLFYTGNVIPILGAAVFGITGWDRNTRQIETVENAPQTE